MKTENLLPTIRFSTRVHSLFNSRFRLTLAVLGKPIGYRPLLGRLPSFWDLKVLFQLIDLENAFFLVKFHLEEDYLRVLEGGPWVTSFNPNTDRIIGLD